jgi:hypothetical protein
VYVRDASSAQGTYIVAPGGSEWMPIGDDSPTLAPGWSLKIGDYIFLHLPPGADA